MVSGNWACNRKVLHACSSIGVPVIPLWFIAAMQIEFAGSGRQPKLLLQHRLPQCKCRYIARLDRAARKWQYRDHCAQLPQSLRKAEIYAGDWHDQGAHFWYSGMLPVAHCVCMHVQYGSLAPPWTPLPDSCFHHLYDNCIIMQNRGQNWALNAIVKQAELELEGS